MDPFVDRKDLIRSLDSRRALETGHSLRQNGHLKIERRERFCTQTMHASIMKDEHKSVPLSDKPRIGLYLGRSWIRLLSSRKLVARVGSSFAFGS